jgi:hypothetical protein
MKSHYQRNGGDSKWTVHESDIGRPSGNVASANRGNCANLENLDRMGIGAGP